MRRETTTGCCLVQSHDKDSSRRRPVVPFRGLLGRISACWAASIVVTLAACGGTQSPVVVRVGDTAINEATVNHWMAVITQEGRATDSSTQARRLLRQRALDFLIASNWLIGEAADRGLMVSDKAIERRLDEQKESTPNGAAEFEEALDTAGKTVSDVKLEIKAELATTMIRQMLIRSAGRVTQPQALAYYRSNLRRFRVPELRDIDLIENLESETAARNLARRVGSGTSFASIALHEPRERPNNFTAGEGKGAIERAIFSAKPGVMRGPMKFKHRYAIFVVRHVRPASIKPLAEVQRTIVKELVTQRRRRVLGEFVRAYRTKWLARTHCHPGFVVQKCIQYNGPAVPEDVFAGS